MSLSLNLEILAFDVNTLEIGESEFFENTIDISVFSSQELSRSEKLVSGSIFDGCNIGKPSVIPLILNLEP